MTKTSPTSKHHAPCAGWARILSATTGDEYVVIAVPPSSTLGQTGVRYAVQRRDVAQERGLQIADRPLPSGPKREKDYRFNGLAGCVTQRVSRDTGTLVGVYHAIQAGLEDDPEIPWVSVCELHNTLVGHGTLALAMAFTNPRAWCDDCRDAARQDPK